MIKNGWASQFGGRVVFAGVARRTVGHRLFIEIG